MDTQSLPRTQWQSFFDEISGSLAGAQVEIEVAGLDIGAQVETTWLPLVGVSYDAKGDAIMVATEQLQHVVAHPTNILIEMHGGALKQVAFEDPQGHSQVIRFRAPLALPAS